MASNASDGAKGILSRRDACSQKLRCAGATTMKDDKTGSEAAIKDPEVKAATIAVALAAAAERMVPIAGADLPQLPTHQEEAQAPSESALRTTTQTDAKGMASLNVDQLLAI